MMTDGFFEFAEDNSTAGFRCNTIELYNWGTFNNTVVTYPLQGRNGLLTGDIGSGKSTLVDAITTLLVPPGKIAYNKAAGADFKERSLRSYVLGYYKSERSDGGFSTKPVGLREPGATHSVILGVFKNEDYAQEVSIAQVFYQKDANGQPQRFYVVADIQLSIKKDFSDFGNDLAHLKRTLKNRDRVEVYESFPEYGAAFQRRFGLKNKQALDLFHQTVSLKTVGNLTNFVQEHMLEPFDSQVHIDNLIHHYDDLSKAHESIMKAKKQIQDLSPLVQNLDTFENINEEIEQKIGYRDNLKYYFADIKRSFLLEKLGMVEQEILEINQKIQISKESLQRLGNDRDHIKQSISEQGGSRIEVLKREISYLEREKKQKQDKAQTYNTLAKQLGFSLANGFELFTQQLHQALNQIKEDTQERNQFEQAATEQHVLFQNLKMEHGKLEEDLVSLHGRKSNIDTTQIRIRNELCKTLNLLESDLPFAGELISIDVDEQEWEGAIERVLRPFALSLLVVDELYEKVSTYIDEAHLRGRLIYYRMGKTRTQNTASVERNSLVAKLKFKTEHPNASWVKAQVYERYKDFVCCESLTELRSVKKGLTKAGQIKSSAIHHEKDDRFAIGDRSRYVLGWINTAKITLLEDQKQQKEKEMQDLALSISNIQRERTTLESRLDVLKAFCLHDQYDSLHWQPLAASIEEKKQEIRILEQKSDILKQLQLSLTQKEQEIAKIQNALDVLQKTQGAAESKQEGYRQSLEREEQLLKELTLPISLLTARIEPLVSKHLGKRTYSYETSSTVEREFREKLQSDIDVSKKRIDRLQASIISAMESFRHAYRAETRDMDASIESKEEYRALLDKLTKENLPRFEQQFKELLNKNTIREIAAFHALLNKENQQIRERVALINKSMYEIDYNKGRYIQLEAIQTNDIDIRNFKHDLKACIEGSLSGDETQQYSEHKFLLVKNLIDRFKGREGFSEIDKRWTNKVTDVRNWFVFAASECWKHDKSEYEHYTDSGGKSGGQKEKLAYTVLAASLAYQFGLEWGEVRSRSFRFVVIDEAFGRGSDDSARYGLDLFKKLDLQLLIVTPLQKIHIIEPYVSSVGFVHNDEGKQSLLRTLTIKQYQAEKEKRNHESNRAHSIRNS